MEKRKRDLPPSRGDPPAAKRARIERQVVPVLGDRRIPVAVPRRLPPAQGVLHRGARTLPAPLPQQRTRDMAWRPQRSTRDIPWSESHRSTPGLLYTQRMARDVSRPESQRSSRVLTTTVPKLSRSSFPLRSPVEATNSLPLSVPTTVPAAITEEVREKNAEREADEQKKRELGKRLRGWKDRFEAEYGRQPTITDLEDPAHVGIRRLKAEFESLKEKCKVPLLSAAELHSIRTAYTAKNTKYRQWKMRFAEEFHRAPTPDDLKKPPFTAISALYTALLDLKRKLVPYSKCAPETRTFSLQLLKPSSAVDKLARVTLTNEELDELDDDPADDLEEGEDEEWEEEEAEPVPPKLNITIDTSTIAIPKGFALKMDAGDDDKGESGNLATQHAKNVSLNFSFLPTSATEDNLCSSTCKESDQPAGSAHFVFTSTASDS
ncbi:hypothetical protein DIPPA_33737 [Diplonema papillatum]|nr:hypothetical protein DIPPA_54563 [Diplonema papillatum]KAJ9459723.1 hypothetical protein DIPPA_33737 [Diplonema papillatum]